MNKKKLKTGPARMKELGNKKIEVWLSEAEWNEFKRVADALGLKIANLARRALSYVGRGGELSARHLKQSQYNQFK